ncbi:type II toxin-antitoxin system death-on-curing family toxin [Rhodobacter sp. KR11]|jgi:death-on-curing protein|uniref:type II toxin-antitoxin system death-on-curing family toxin n=1 Tax=Rhodobacter sp. KR11 TaxID=2974588 RepID=UPI00222136EF|nr:type II toxin-antitoxin system death-on-curing family toxin [Rhodobacter sp. KR11]MCW1920637.1 type II toxin-antitoxin system death-on-curing family toxin [Rhodobacter sp. KR11]
MRHYRVTLMDVIAAHDEALTYGGRPGILNLDGIESAIGRPYSGYHRKISQKAAALLEALAQNHGFVDGNKRTALLATLLLIGRSGYDLVLVGDEWIDDVVVLVAEGQMAFPELETWFSQRLVRTG